jgi:hypothetical protein
MDLTSDAAIASFRKGFGRPAEVDVLLEPGIYVLGTHCLAATTTGVTLGFEPPTMRKRSVEFDK